MTITRTYRQRYRPHIATRHTSPQRSGCCQVLPISDEARCRCTYLRSIMLWAAMMCCGNGRDAVSRVSTLKLLP